MILKRRGSIEARSSLEMYHRLKEVNVVPQEPLEVKKQGIPFKDCIYK